MRVDGVDCAAEDHVAITLGCGRSWHRVGTAGGRATRYEARAGTAVTVARDATFAAELLDDGSWMFVVRRGTVMIRSIQGGAVVLHDAEAVTLSPAGGLDEVAQVDPDDLTAHEWVRVNELLDGNAPVELGSDGLATDAPPARPPGWAKATKAKIVSVAVALAASAAAATLVVGGPNARHLPAPRRGPAPPPVQTTGRASAPADPAAPLNGDVSGAGPSSATVAEAPTTTVPAPAPTLAVSGRSCTRGAGPSVTYTASVTNTSATAGAFLVHIVYADGAGRVIGASDERTGRLEPEESATISARLTGPAARLVRDCSPGGVTAVAG